MTKNRPSSSVEIRLAKACSRMMPSATSGTVFLKCGGWYMRWFPRSFPLEGGRRLAAHIVRDAVDAVNFIDDAAGDLLEQRVGQFRPVGRHEVARLHGTQGHHVIVSAPVAHHANALERQEHREHQ